mgnify:CR=1 FL=1|jgi:small subunit ribosomal protein S9
MATTKKETKKKEVIKEEKVEKVEVVENTAENTKVKKEKKKSKAGLFTGTGRRKTAVARVFLYDEKGPFTVNDMPISEYFPFEKTQSRWEKPFHAVGVSHPESKYSATIKVEGSGKPSQMDAIILGLSKALAKIDEEFDKTLRKQSFMTRDSRMVERKKPFFRKARKKPQYSKR